MNASMPKELHLIFKTHLDIGFTDYARNVVDLYFSRFIPQALTVAQALREAGGPERFVWTTGSWLIYEYLEQATPPERSRMEQAIAAGDLVWHGLPFTFMSEFLDASLFEFGLTLSQELDRRFGKQTIAAKMTDVPGHTRGIVPLLAQAGIQFLHLGINPGSTAPDVPPLFVWQDPGGANIIVMYNKGSYGDLVLIPGLSEAIAFAHSSDNLGPQSVDEVREVFHKMRQQFPNAQIIASNLNTFAEKLRPIKPQLPVVTGEMGDTWIHGIGTDPKKVSQFRELARLRRRWLADGRVPPDDRRLAKFSRFLLQAAEHTWGMDEKTHLADTSNYTAAQFQAARTTEKYVKFAASWDEQRQYLRDAVSALGDLSLTQEAATSLATLVPTRPDVTGFTRITDLTSAFETTHFVIGFDANCGALNCLIDKATGRNWAADAHWLGCFRYETFSHHEYERFQQQYNILSNPENLWWILEDFGKPGLEAVETSYRQWETQLAELYLRQEATGQYFVLHLTIPDECSTVYGCPRTLIMEIFCPFEQPQLELTFQWFDKPASRLPEALWLSFTPKITDASGWTLEKMGEYISPLEVLPNGNRKLHAMGTGIFYRDEAGQLAIESLDAPLVAPGEPSLLNFNNDQPDITQGMHFNLYNNIWGTNFPMWYDEDARFRFVLHVKRKDL
jgi:hypothetical protein